MRHCIQLGLVIPLCISVAACSEDVQLTDGGGGGRDGGGIGDGSSTGDGGASDATTGLGGTREEFCMGSGTVARVGDSVEDDDASVCAGGLAERTFRYALCVCERTNVASEICTDAFDSSDGPYDPGPDAPDCGDGTGWPVGGDFGGSIGVNGRYCGSGFMTLHGHLLVGARQPEGGADLCPTSPPSAVELTDRHDIAGNFHSNGNLHTSVLVNVAGDAYVNGDVLGDDELNIGGSLHQPSGATVAGTVNVGGERVTEPVDIPPPCDCDPDRLLDAADIVDWGRLHNDNDVAPVGPDGGVSDGGVSTDELTSGTVELPCGRYFFEGIDAGDLTLRLEGRTVLFIDGDVNVPGNLVVELVGDDAEVDMFVRGDVNVDGHMVYGREDRPAAARMYVGGTRVDMSGTATFVGNVYAPFAVVLSTDRLRVFGSVFARNFETSSEAFISFDRAITRAGDSCDDDDPNPPCTSCHDCRSSEACVDGVCGACSQDSDCCSPNVCDPDTGMCVPLLE